jgi:PleD family two-component response regulator
VDHRHCQRRRRADAGAVESLIAAADAALYEAKRAGKNRLGSLEGA